MLLPMSRQKPSHPRLTERPAALDARRNLKMARSAHAYVRGNTEQFYAWLRSDAGLKVPQGPPIWICGDCHVGNLGPIATSAGKVEIQIRDLDQTVIGNPAHDLIRLGLSLASSARGSDLPGVTTARMIEQMMEGYEQAFADAESAAPVKRPKPEAVKVAMEDALRRKWRHLAQERIDGASAGIPLGARFWPVTLGERAHVEALFKNEKARRLVTSLRSRDSDAPLEVVDVAFWVKGCSSLGRLRYAALLRVGGKHGELCLIDIKEACETVAPRHPRSEMPRDEGERVVRGAWHLSPALGERMMSTTLDGHAVFLRELLPQDLKFEIEQLTLAEAVKVAKFLASVVGKAHARQMDAPTRQRWEAELQKNRTPSLDAPSWLWTSVVNLLVTHEGAYLEHCRRYAQLAAA